MKSITHYPGTELHLFQSAVNWKQTIQRHIQPFLAGDVLEVGAGIGGTTQVLLSGREKTWTCLEPDPGLASIISMSSTPVDVVIGTLDVLDANKIFNTIIYIDVLEHIEDDRAELVSATRHLAPGGSLVILCPAHQYLFSPFDRSIGHFRRYDKQMFRELRPEGLQEVRMFYLDSIGLLVSLLNKVLLKQSIPSARQVLFWDRIVVRLSRVIDSVLHYSVGKSVVAVWQKTG